MSDLDRLSDVITSIHSLAIDDNAWPTALREINDLIGGEFVFYIRYRYGGDVVIDDVRDLGTGVGHWDQYAKYSHIDPKVSTLVRMPKFGIISDYDYITQSEIDRHPFYQELLSAHGICYTIGAKLATQSANGTYAGAYLAVHRAPDRGHVDKREIELMRSIAHHMSHAAEIGRHLHLSKTLQMSQRATLDLLPDAVFILKPDGALVDANDRAARMLRAGCPLRLHRSSLITNHPASTKVLHDLIAAAAQRAPGPQAGQALPIEWDDPLLRPLLALATPLPPSDQPLLCADEALNSWVLLIVSDPNDRPTTVPERLTAFFNLTPAEARLAAAMVNGMTVKDYVEETGLAENTVRWTIRKLLAKSDDRRQEEMVRRFSAWAATASSQDSDDGGDS